MQRSTREQNHATMNLMLTLSIALLAVPFCSGSSDYGDETRINWSDYPQAVFIEDVDAATFYMGFWVSRKFVVGPKDASSSDLANFKVQSGDIINAPLTHVVDKVIDIGSVNSGEVAVYKICNPPPPPLKTQKLEAADYWDSAATNTSGLFLYAKHPTKELHTRTAGNLPKQSECADVLAQGECAAIVTTAAHEVCAEWDPKPDACQHIVDASGTLKTNPWLLIDGRLQAFLEKSNCKSDGSSLSGPIFGTIRFSLSEIKKVTYL